MSQPFADDRTLIVHIARGERWAFETLYERYSGQALGLAVRVLQDRTLGEDVLQEAFWRIWVHAGRFDHERGNVRAWVLTIVRRLAIDEHRRGSAHAVIEIDAEENQDWDIEDESADVSEHVLERISSAQVRRALADLPQKNREVIELAFFHGLTHRQIAERLGEPVGTIHSRALQSMAALKELLRQRV